MKPNFKDMTFKLPHRILDRLFPIISSLLLLKGGKYTSTTEAWLGS